MNYNELEQIIGYNFNDKLILKKSLTHSSVIGEENYEDFEFLGDSFLSFVVADYLLKNSELPVGELSKIRAKLVSTDNLCKIVKNNGIFDYIIFGKSINKVNLSNKICADIFESLLAGIYLDGGEQSAKDFVYKFVIISDINVYNISNDLIDYKTVLQEKVHKIKDLKIKYTLIQKKGEDNNPIFTVALFINDEMFCKCENKSKQLAEKDCAKKYLDYISTNNI